MGKTKETSQINCVCTGKDKTYNLKQEQVEIIFRGKKLKYRSWIPTCAVCGGWVYVRDVEIINDESILEAYNKITREDKSE